MLITPSPIVVKKYKPFSSMINEEDIFVFKISRPSASLSIIVPFVNLASLVLMVISPVLGIGLIVRELLSSIGAKLRVFPSPLVDVNTLV